MIGGHRRGDRWSQTKKSPNGGYATAAHSLVRVRLATTSASTNDRRDQVERNFTRVAPHMTSTVVSTSQSFDGYEQGHITDSASSQRGRMVTRDADPVSRNEHTTHKRTRTRDGVSMAVCCVCG